MSATRIHIAMETSEHDAVVPVRSFEDRFLEERNALMVQRLRLALTMGLSIYAGFWCLDLVLHPSIAVEFGMVRLVVSLLCLGALLSTYRVLGRRYIHAVSVAAITTVGLSLSLMTIPLGGFASDYFIGNMLTLFFVGMMMPWPTWTTATVSALIILPYFVLNIVVYGWSVDMASPTAFLGGTAMLTVFASSRFERLRLQDLSTRVKLERANEELKQLDEAKTRFFANVSHELRTPLMLISGPLAELRADMGPSAPPVLESIAVNADRLTRHVNNILDFARIEGGRLQAKMGTQNLGYLLDQLVHSARPYATQHALTLSASGLNDIEHSRFDREHIETAAANLLSNAVKFTPDGGAVQVRAGQTRDTVWFEVEDTGPGIAPDELERIFDRFYQVERGPAGKSKGTGLGLALCRELIKLHAGTLTVASEPGQGACFRVTIPKAPPECTERRVRGRRREDRIARAKLESFISDSYQERAGTQTLFADLKTPETQSAALATVASEDAPVLLIVEDDPELRAYLARNLAGDYQVDLAHDGIAGLEAARRRKPDLILSDVMMPRMSGSEMVKFLSRDPSLMDVPVIMVTARAGDDAVIESLSLGAIDYVLKPFKLPELKARVGAHIRARHTEKQLDERETRLAAIGNMTGQIAHDLKGPLTAIVGHTGLARELAQSNPEAAFLVEDLDAVEEAASRAVTMIQEVVDYVREGSVPIQAEPTQIRAFVDTVLHSIRDSMSETRGAVLTLRPSAEGDPAEWVLPVDQVRMRRVLENLIGNAREALTEQTIPGFGPPPTVWVDVRSDPGGVLIRVADNGPGIPSDVADSVFNPFVTAGKAQGTGLGLAIVRNLVTAHGGTVRVELNPPEEGAAFRIVLPLPDDP